MRFINRRITKLLGVCCALALLTGCAHGASYALPYRVVHLTNELSYEDVATPFSDELCVVASDVDGGGIYFDDDECAGLFDLNNKEVLYAHRVHERLDPASMTKVMTALIAIENGQPDMRLTASTSNYITDKDAQMLTLSKGDSMTMQQALHFLLVYSANDVAMLIAEGVAGSVDKFVDMMNAKARELGATNTHFANPHGLTDEAQYTTAYDMYLMFNAAMRYDTFQEIIRMPSYKTQYFRSDGTQKEVEVSSTNAFVRENSSYTAPAGATVIGGKTGSTDAAGQCLILLFKDVANAPYIAIYAHAPDVATLYRKMGALMEMAAR